ncbi:MAG TPA: hypothetical protein VJI33_04320 [Candidatus Paceibacterota bacterium]
MRYESIEPVEPENLHLETEQGGEERLKREYLRLLRRHQEIADKAMVVGFKSPYVPQFSEKRAARLSALEKELHAIHLKLIESGKLIGKNEADIATDLFLMKKNLEEFTLDAGLITFERNRKPYEDSVSKMAALSIFKEPEVISLINDIQAIISKLKDGSFAETDWTSSVGAVLSRVKQILKESEDRFRIRPGMGKTVETIWGDANGFFSILNFIKVDLGEATAKDKLSRISILEELDERIRIFENCLRDDFQAQQLILPDEVGIIFGSSINAYYNKDGQECGSFSEDVEHNDYVFSKGFEQKMFSLQRLLDEHPELVTPFATTQNEISHEGFREYGLVCKKENLQKVIDLMIEQRERYWVPLDVTQESARYVLQSRSRETGHIEETGLKQKDFKEFKSIPTELLDNADMESRALPERDDWKEKLTPAEKDTLANFRKLHLAKLNRRVDVNLKSFDEYMNDPLFLSVLKKSREWYEQREAKYGY